MKKTLLLLVSILMAFSCVNAQWGNEKIIGNGNMVSKIRTIGGYDGIRVSGNLNVELISGMEGDLKIEAESNLQEFIKTEVRKNVLHISTKNGVNLQPEFFIKILIPVESINEIALTGSGKINNRDLIKTSEMDLQITGSGEMNLRLEAESINGKVTGSGDVILSGETDRLKCMVTGSGNFRAQNLSARMVSARVSGSGDILVNPSLSLKASTSGSGSVRYKNKPEKLDIKTNGSGGVSSM